ncbi:MAG TPA: hypothetical protein VLA12_15090 [Planctomycetaceae bacterium]|nr:hypothetical protein [Planctomycetaceae bacterium]
MKSLNLTLFRVVWIASILLAVMSFTGEKFSGFLSGNPLSNEGAEFPTSAPREENRVSAAEGFSLIAPEGWKAIRGENQLLFVPGSRASTLTSLRVTLLEDRYRHPVPLPATHTFQNGPAYSVIRTEPAEWGEPGRYELSLVLERDQQLYELRYESAGGDEPGIRAHVWRHFETFTTEPSESLTLGEGNSTGD